MLADFECLQVTDNVHTDFFFQNTDEWVSLEVKTSILTGCLAGVGSEEGSHRCKYIRESRVPPIPLQEEIAPPIKNKKNHTKAGAEGLGRPWSGGGVSEEEEEEKERREKEEGRVESLCSLAG